MEKTVAVRLTLLAAQYKAGLADASGATRQFATGAAAQAGKVGDNMQRVGGTMTRTLTPAAAVAGAAFLKMFNDFDAGVDALRAGTGATGEQLDALTESLKSVAAEVPIAFGQVGQIMADVNTRTGATGETLEALTKQFAQLEFLGNAASVENVTRVFGDWAIATEDQSEAMDTLFKVSQMTGPSVDRIGQLVVQYGAPLREFGFGFEDAALMMGKFEKEGVNTQLVMGGLRIALANFARAGRDPKEALAGVFAEIERLGPGAESTSLAMETFGARAGADFGRAIAEGRFSLEEMTAALEANGETINAAAEDSIDLVDQLKMMSNTLVGILGPVSEFGMILAGVAMGLGPATTMVGGLLKGVGALPAAIGKARTAMTGFMATHSALTGALAAGGVLIAGAVVAWQLWENAVKSTDDQIKAIGDTQRRHLKTESYDDLIDRMGRIGEQVTKLDQDVKNSRAPWDADYREQLKRGINELQGVNDEIGQTISLTNGLSAATGLSQDAALKWLQSQMEAGIVYGDVQTALAGYTGWIDENKLSAEEAKTAQEGYAQSIKDAADEMKAVTDPFFAARRAQGQLKDAQDDYNTAVFLFGDGSKEATDAYVALMEAGFNYEGALLALESAQADGMTSQERFTEQLAILRAHGLDPTTLSAFYATGSFFDLIAAADEAGTRSVSIPTSAPGLAETLTQFERLLGLGHQYEDLMGYMGPIAGRPVEGGGPNYMGPVLGRANGGPLSPRSVYRLHDTDKAEAVTMGGNTYLFTGSEGGHATPLDSFPASNNATSFAFSPTIHTYDPEAAVRTGIREIRKRAAYAGGR